MMPGKEIIARPEEITVVYYTDDFKYEENKLVGPAAAIFDQHNFLTVYSQVTRSCFRY